MVQNSSKCFVPNSSYKPHNSMKKKKSDYHLHFKGDNSSQKELSNLPKLTQLAKNETDIQAPCSLVPQSTCHRQFPQGQTMPLLQSTQNKLTRCNMKTNAQPPLTTVQDPDTLPVISTLWQPNQTSHAPQTLHAAAAKQLQSCPTLWDPIDGSPPGSSVRGILQARTLEWVALSFSKAYMHAKSLQSCPTLCDPMDSSAPGSLVHRIFQARILEWVVISFSTNTSY